MAKKDGRRYTAKFKFQVVLEALRSQKAWKRHMRRVVGESR